MTEKQIIARLRAIKYQISNQGKYLQQPELEKLIQEIEQLEKSLRGKK